MGSDDFRNMALHVLNEAIRSVDPFNLIEQQVLRREDTLQFRNGPQIDLKAFKRVFVIGAGKGTAPMARGMESILGNRLTAGSIIVKYGHVDDLKTIRQLEAGHPVPDQNTLQASQIIVENLRDLSEDDCVFVLLTGGGSALFELLPDSISLEDLKQLNKALLGCGAGIHEINCVRKHVSRIKGGQLARYIYPATCVTLALSDVIGDDLSVIASGPTSPDASTYEQAVQIIEKYSIRSILPDVIIDHLLRGQAEEIEETPKPGDTLFDRVHNLVIGNNRLALETAKQIATDRGFKCSVLTSQLEGEAREIARVLGSITREIQDTGNPVSRPACLLLGGEPTVHIRGDGKGGRNQELALAFALNKIRAPFLFISCGSDGTDGPTDAAGAIVSEKTIEKSEQIGISALQHLEKNDSYNFFSAINDLIVTGPTGTNVMDLIMIFIP